jgi:site-specific DNA-methyltransferase (adenine-specific)
MRKTKTSSFGVSKRESHDSSGFYGRNLTHGVFASPLSAKELAEIEAPGAGDWANAVYCQSSEDMHQVPDNSVGLAFTSPPYNVGKDYDDDIGLKEYLELIRKVGKEVYRALRPGGRYVINIANLGRRPYIPLQMFYYQIHADLHFLPMGEVIWLKGRGASGSCAWGSWMSAKAPRQRDIHEYLLIFGKQSFSRPDHGASDIPRDEFMSSTLSVWEIPPESARRVGHPAPFPVDLAARVIRLYSYAGDVILDPFAGSGTTCVAAVQNGRYYVGYDLEPGYCELAAARIQEAKNKLSL